MTSLSWSAAEQEPDSSGLLHSWGHAQREEVRALGFRSYPGLSNKQKNSPGSLPLFSWAGECRNFPDSALYAFHNFSFIKADIMTMPPTHSTVIMKAMLLVNNTLCSWEVQQRQRNAALPQNRLLHTDQKHPHQTPETRS